MCLVDVFDWTMKFQACVHMQRCARTGYLRAGLKHGLLNHELRAQ